MEGEKIWVCEDSQEGIFTGIYDAWASGYKKEECVIQVGEIGNYRLFAQYFSVKTEEEKAWKVAKTILRRMGERAYRHICSAISSTDQEKGNAVFHTLILGFAMEDASKAMTYLSNPYVGKVFTLSRQVYNEVHHFMEFLRFRQLEIGILFAKIHPKNDILTHITPHFADRLPMEDFIIYDSVREKMAIHPKKKRWSIVQDKNFQIEKTKEESKDEEQIQELFRSFCKTIAVKERENKELQRQMLPLKFRDNMPEFEESKWISHYEEKSY